jgi:uncharacterized protein
VIISLNLHHPQPAVLISNGVGITPMISMAKAEADYFLCGSTSFMDAIRDGLRAWGVADDRVMFESFAKSTPKIAKAGGSVTTITSDSKEIVFSKSGRTHTWNLADGTILEFAEANGLRPEYSCREGICGTCTCKIAEGEVEYQEQPIATVERDSVLICISHPKTARVVLDL